MVKVWGTPQKVFIDSNSDQEFSPHIPILEDYYRTYLTEKVRHSCQPTSDWSGELTDTTQLAPPNTRTLTNTGKTYRTTPYHPIGQTKMISGQGKTYGQARTQSTLKPAPPNPSSKGYEDSEWSKYLHPHNSRAKAPLQVSPSKPPPGWPKGIRTNPTAHSNMLTI